MKAAPGRGRRALVVEDDPDIGALIEAALEDLGFAVSRVDNGQDAVIAVKDESPDLITLDLSLPGLDGIEVCRQIREMTDAYIIMITARINEIDRLQGLETGADDFMPKPFSLRELQARVNAMFRRPRQTATGPADDLRYGVLHIDMSSRRVYRDDQELVLTRIEYELLVELMRDPERVATREELMQSVWGTDWTGDTHLVEVHVGNLRRKLRPAGYIRTVRGVGYRMDLDA
ncbi:response regulator transcription factor [Nocardioides mangrovi]|uniref:Response regulator transcription factor n=1 Tax=Nocardioides mangrovi TaxID=2874580 RepID=A0ABS7UH18_9ACTN|nr:response regulator transcription factor [Nocardioides mangrovi]MBZ5740305.1 response regulator transcription factor [Nocardioides mangrovi]